MKKFRRAVNAVGGLLIMCGIAYAVYGFSTAEEGVRKMCSQIKPGMSVAEVNTFGADHGLAPKLPNEPGIHFMVESKTFGRHGCHVEVEAGIIKKAGYTFSN